MDFIYGGYNEIFIQFDFFNETDAHNAEIAVNNALNDADATSTSLFK